MIGRLGWLGGRTTARDEEKSRKRARGHRSRVAREARRTRRDQTNRPRWND